MSSLEIILLFGLLLLLLFCSAFFSGSETSMMAINRYRLRHLAEKKHPAAMRVSRLLERPDRLIGVILLGNNFVNILASSIATIIAIELLNDEIGIPVAAALLTIAVLIFSEVTPKTIAALYPEKLAFPASFVIRPLLSILYPIVWIVNLASNALLRLGGFSHQNDGHRLDSEELRTVVREAEGIIPYRHQQMLLSILDLENATVEDIMIPRNEIVGVDLDEPLEKITEQLANCQHTRLPIYRTDINRVKGVIHLRKLLRLFKHHEMTLEDIEDSAKDVYFVPEGTPLNTQLINFQRHKRRIGLVVNEYGEVQGLVTLEDILEEIVGEFTTNPDAVSPDIHQQNDGSYLVDAGISVRELNRVMHWHLPTTGPKTLNGLILNHLETIPEAGISLRLEQEYPVEIVQTSSNAVKTVKVYPFFIKNKIA